MEKNKIKVSTCLLCSRCFAIEGLSAVIQIASAVVTITNAAGIGL